MCFDWTGVLSTSLGETLRNSFSTGLPRYFRTLLRAAKVAAETRCKICMLANGDGSVATCESTKANSVRSFRAAADHDDIAKSVCSRKWFKNSWLWPLCCSFVYNPCVFDHRVKWNPPGHLLTYVHSVVNVILGSLDRPWVLFQPPILHM